MCISSVINILFVAGVTTQFPRGEDSSFSNLIINSQNRPPHSPVLHTCPRTHQHAHNLQLLQHKVHLLLRGQRGQDGVVAPAGQLGVVVRVLCRDELEAGVAHQMPTFTAHVFWNGWMEQKMLEWGSRGWMNLKVKRLQHLISDKRANKTSQRHEVTEESI